MQTTGSGRGRIRTILDPGVVVADDYRIDALLGDGGMGVVYEATQLSLDRKIALKLIASDLSDDLAFRERFRREGRIQAQIDHPHIIDVYGAGQSPYGMYLAMRLVRGPSLKEMIVGANLTIGRAARIMSQIASALDAAHAVGLVHRDIKPHNILIDELRSRSYLADFGVTKARGGETGLTRAGQLVGTLDYMAPEQFRGHEASELSDIYAFGAVLYESIVGSVPFPRPTDGAVMYAHLSDPVPSVCERLPALPADLDGVIAKAMAKKPEERFESAAQMMEAVARILETVADESVLAKPPPAEPRSETSVGTRAGETPASQGNRETELAREAPVTAAARTAPAQLAQPTALRKPETVIASDGAGQGTLVTTRDEAPVTPAPSHETVVSPTEPDRRPTDPLPPDGPIPQRRQVEKPRVEGRRRAAVAGALVAVAGLGAAGFFSGHGQSDEKAAAPSVPAQRVVHEGGMAVSVPSRWKRTQSTRTLPGLHLATPVSFSPGDGSESGVVVGRAASAWPSFLPKTFRAQLGASAVRRPELVRLGELDAFRYRGLEPKGMPGMTATVYAVPQPARTAIVACYAASGTTASLAKCDEIAASLRLDGQTAYPLAAPSTYAKRVNTAVTTLKADRGRGLRKITAAKTRAAEADAASVITGAYRRAAARVRGVTPTAYVLPAHRQLVTALTRVAAAYASLAAAARAGDQGRFDRLRHIVRARESRLGTELARLIGLGFRG